MVWKGCLLVASGASSWPMTSWRSWWVSSTNGKIVAANPTSGHTGCFLCSYSTAYVLKSSCLVCCLTTTFGYSSFVSAKSSSIPIVLLAEWIVLLDYSSCYNDYNGISHIGLNVASLLPSNPRTTWAILPECNPVAFPVADLFSVSDSSAQSVHSLNSYCESLF